MNVDVCIDVFGGGSGPWVWVDQGIWWLDDVLLATSEKGVIPCQ